VFGYALSTIAKPFLYLANSWSWVLGVRFADRFGKGIRTAPRDSLLALSTASNQRGIAFGLHRAGDTAGAFIGLGIATLIIWFTQSTTKVLTRLTFHYVILASIIPAVLAVLILIVGLREVQVQNQSSIPPSLINNWKYLNRRFQIFLVIVILFTLGNSSDSFIILRGQERGLNILQIMAMLMTFNVVYSLLASPAGWLSDKIGRRKIIITGWGIYGLIYLGLALAKTPSQVWTLYGFYGVYYAMTEGVAKALVADLVPAEQRGTAYGFFNAAIGITALPASLFAGILWQGIGSWTGFGPAAPFIFGSLMALCACLLFLVTD
jgi:MFS family permease